MPGPEAADSRGPSEVDDLRIVEVRAEEYQRLFPRPATFFHSVALNVDRAGKCEQLMFLVLMKAKRPRIGLIGATRDGVFLSPFAGPYGGPQPISPGLSQQYISSFPPLLNDYLKLRGIRSLKIVLPPMFYGEDYLSGLANSLAAGGYQIAAVDLSYFANLSSWDAARLPEMQWVTSWPYARPPSAAIPSPII